MKRSLRTRLIIIFSSMLIVTIGTICLANVVLLPSFYQNTKVNQMQGVYSRTVKICEDVDWENLNVTAQNKIYDKLDTLSINANVSIYVVQIKAYRGSGDITALQYVYPAGSDRLQQVSRSQLSKYVKEMYYNEPLGDNCQIINQTVNYSMYKVYDDRVESNFIELTGRMTIGCICVRITRVFRRALRSPISF